MNKRKMTITIKLEELDDRAVVTGELFEHLMKWLSITKNNRLIKNFTVETSLDALTENYERNMRRHRNR